MNRRVFISLIGGAAAWPLLARAQQPAMPVIGFLNGASPAGYVPYVAAFNEGLKEGDYVDGRNVAIEYRWAEGRHDRLPALAADLVRRRVNVIAATGGTPSALAAKAAVKTIPIVFITGSDPVQTGLVASFNRPGGSVTGIYTSTGALPTKGLELLHELAPWAAGIALLINPTNPNLSESAVNEVQTAARTLGKQIHVLNASTEAEIDAAFVTLAQLRAGALVIVADVLFNDRREKIAALALRHTLPSIHGRREYAAAGGLMSYGASLTDIYRQAGVYVGKILKGAQPADLPIMQSTKFELVINLKTAKALGVDVPPSFYWRADEVIE